MSAKSPTTSTPSPAFARRGDVAREITSEHISEHLAAFRASGGKVEVLGNTPLHKAVPPASAGKKSAPAAR